MFNNVALRRILYNKEFAKNNVLSIAEEDFEHILIEEDPKIIYYYVEQIYVDNNWYLMIIDKYGIMKGVWIRGLQPERSFERYFHFKNVN